MGTKRSENLVEIHPNTSIDENAFENDVCKMAAILSRPQFVNLLRPRQNGRHFEDGIFKLISLNGNV